MYNVAYHVTYHVASHLYCLVFDMFVCRPTVFESNSVELPLHLFIIIILFPANVAGTQFAQNCLRNKLPMVY